MSKHTKRSVNRGADLKSSSFTEPVVRVLGGKAKGKSRRNGQSKPSQIAGTRPRLIVFHKKKDKSDAADVLGTGTLNTWKKSSGHNKSWKICRRLKITQDYLELLTSSNGHPVSFGWQFSTTNTPASFVRSQGRHVNKQPRVRRVKTLPAVPINKNLDDEYGPDWPPPKGPPHRYRSAYGDILSHGSHGGFPKRFFRLNITCEAVNVIVEAPLEEVKLITQQSLPLPEKEQQGDIVLERLIFLDIIRNDSHADVYLVQDPNNSSQPYHAYAFLSEGMSKNKPSFRRRKIARLRKSHDFHAETVESGRQIIVMKANPQADDTFHLKNTQQEFPSLPGTATKPWKTGQTKYRRSYAAVLGRERPSKKAVISNHLAYKAWQERHGLQRHKKSNIVTTLSIPNWPAAKFEEVTARIKEEEVPKMPLANRFAIFSSVGVCEDW